MKSISVNISEPVYRDFMEHARRSDRTAAELIREAMQLYRDERIHASRSLLDLPPLDLGQSLRPLTTDADLLGEMLDEHLRH